MSNNRKSGYAHSAVAHAPKRYTGRRPTRSDIAPQIGIATIAQAAFLSELFGARVRYSGASLGSQLASVVAGGLSPFIATALLPYGRGALAAYVIAMALVTIVSVLAASETRHRDIAIH